VILNVNCERCGALLIRGGIYNYRGKTLCEDCNVLMYLYVGKAPDPFLPDLPKRGRKIL